MRDDFGLIALNNTEDADDLDKNYIIINRKKTARVIINEFKTSGKYEPVDKKLSPELSRLIMSYIDDKEIEVGDYLFGKEHLSDFVNKENLKMGIIGGFNLLRKMMTEEHKHDSERDKDKLAREMKHSRRVHDEVYTSHTKIE
jgi:hypothetical protein